MLYKEVLDMQNLYVVQAEEKRLKEALGRD